ncbi:MAG: winged helix-turn-helix domain-containing protein [Planctomycetes bacterium]|nr:winged helix-turn-helix domain-containing protein [Planctomycetota bacterium]MBU4400163.1 winged helix-turn-helix domain-containing protein [Planctomycetota bacterium]MCG2685727.1 winged helix-turn-helix domain-containing protein [Planctomycetales bacterium]
MAKKTPVPCLTSIGETAGMVWRTLSENGPMTMAKLVKGMGEPRDTVMLALGWLARENKIDIEEDGRRRVVSLS